MMTYKWHINDIYSPFWTKEPAPMSGHPFRDEIFPNIQSKPLLEKLEAISPCPIAGYRGSIGAIGISEG